MLHPGRSPPQINYSAAIPVPMAPKPGEGMPPEVLALTRKIATPKEMLQNVLSNLGFPGKPTSYFEQHFNDCLQAMMDEGLRLLHREQRKVLKEVMELSASFEETAPEKADNILWKGIQSLTNQKRKRAGVHMELCVGWILRKCEIPIEEGRVETGRSDLICPNIETFRRNPELCIVLEFKRTIRERWKEVRDEISRSGNHVWLLTLDDFISNDVVSLIAAGNITLYVPEAVHAKLNRNPSHLRSIRTFVTDLRVAVGRSPQTRLADSS